MADADSIILEELAKTSEGEGWRAGLRSTLFPLLAVVTGLIIGGLFIAFTTEEVYAGFRD